MVVEAKRSVDPPTPPEQQLGGYIDELRKEWELDRNDIYGLIIAGRGDLDSLVSDVRESEYSGQIRVIDVERILHLLDLKRKHLFSHAQVAELLLASDVIDLTSMVELTAGLVDRVDFWQRVRHETGIHRGEAKIEFSEEYNHKENLENFVQFMFGDGLITREDLPVGASENRYFIHRKSEYKKGNEMADPVEIEDGAHMETTFEIDQKKRLMERLALEYGIRRRVT